MRAGATIVVAASSLLGCASLPRDSAQAAPRSAAEWTQRCAAHLEAARRAVLPRVPLLAQATMKIEPAGAGIKVTTDEIDAQGKPISRSYTVNFDGQDVPNRVAADRDMIAWKRIDAHTWETTTKGGGQVTATSKRVVSPDGKVFTLTTTSWNAQGQPVIAVMVYDKQ